MKRQRAAERETGKRERGSLSAGIVLILLGVLAGALGAFIALNIRVPGAKATDPEPLITANAVLERLEEAKDLVSLEYHYRNVGTYEVPPSELFGIPLPLTGKKAIVVYTGTIKAGIDVGDVRASVDDLSRVVTLDLPQGKIISHEMDRDSMVVYDQDASVFTPFGFDEPFTFLRAEQKKVEEEALASGLLDQAREEAGETLKAFVAGMPGIVEYRIDIR